ncbi:hypothetical protein SLITO_v1c06440 [Spiroplasma litorale]|uniref:Transmembrane protein n=1 Tax=Spiroplasma litorale TaxID=216942 RepID=A0A0K1W285_9MOLU|nr:hypothetical protein [Spiroplasma litorale]AKX34273.1 hypothetical protein SLITO_v1c06440 [Spiroplasma litorale]
MSLNKKYLWRMIYSCIVWLIITICILAIGFDIVAANGDGGSKTIFKGWSKDVTVASDGKSTSTGFNSLGDVFKNTDYQSILNKGLFAVSVLAFLFSFLYFIYTTIIYIVSFKKTDFINNKTQLILDIVFTILIALFAVITLAGMASVSTDLNKPYVQNNLDPKFKLGTNFAITTALIVIGLIGHVVCASLVNTKYK